MKTTSAALGLSRIPRQQWPEQETTLGKKGNLIHEILLIRALECQTTSAAFERDPAESHASNGRSKNNASKKESLIHEDLLIRALE